MSGDFTISRYRRLLDIAREVYTFSEYESAQDIGRGVFWRHDVDCSLNRALRLAAIEAEVGVSATYFLNPHSEFYNLLEKSQADIVLRILALGHRIGLHFDAAFHELTEESRLDELVACEAGWLESWFGVRPVAFSFHNPTEFLLKCDADRYGGLVNCYSAFFRNEVGYCSDSNGYWRFRPLEEVLAQAREPRLQVLTHPEWWQEEEMPPRDRIVRCVQGRAKAVLENYDAGLAASGRRNIGLPDDEG